MRLKSLQWSWIDSGRQHDSLPAEKSKSKKPRALPIIGGAMDVIRAAGKVGGRLPVCISPSRQADQIISQSVQGRGKGNRLPELATA